MVQLNCLDYITGVLIWLLENHTYYLVRSIFRQSWPTRLLLYAVKQLRLYNWCSNLTSWKPYILNKCSRGISINQEIAMLLSIIPFSSSATDLILLGNPLVTLLDTLLIIFFKKTTNLSAETFEAISWILFFHCQARSSGPPC